MQEPLTSGFNIFLVLNRIPEDYYSKEDGDERHFNRILKWYADYFKSSNPGASMLFPIGKGLDLSSPPAFGCMGSVRTPP